MSAHPPMLRGTLLALAAAVAFGGSTPLLQRASSGLGPFTTAALLYAGAALATTLGTRPGREASLRRAHAPRLLLVALFGAVIAPACLAFGLARTSGALASLLLSLEAPLTMLLARAFHDEPIGRRAGVASLLLAGGAALSATSATTHGQGLLGAMGALAVVLATAAWALDNTLTRPLADVDPAAVVRAKGSLGAFASTAIAAALHEPAPSLAAAAGVLACGAIGYGASLRLYLRAQRSIGAGRTASVFASAPLVGVAVAVALGEHAFAPATAIAFALFVAGIAIHATEPHAHAHEHAAIEHEHAHRHDDGHHDHAHEPPVDGVHSHPHRHEARVHAHPHAPDLHHRHEH